MTLLMGSETEFGLMGGWDGPAARDIHEQVQARHLHLPGPGESLFLDNGARVYQDGCGHNEYCTPEVDDPALLVRCELAGRRLMQAAAEALGQSLFCANVDYGAGHTWGTHENYGCTARPGGATLAAIQSHLATRIVFAGAGGMHPFQPGISPVLSPRAAFIGGLHNEQGTEVRSMVFRKPGHHGAGYRLHLLPGECLMSPQASWLKYGTTALLVCAFDRKLIPPDGLILRNPLQALHRLNRDAGLTCRVVGLDGRRLTACQWQRRMADAVGRQLDGLPHWAGQVLEAWHHILDRMERRDPTLTGTIDWLLFRKVRDELAHDAWAGPGVDDLVSPDGDRSDPPAETRGLWRAGQELYIRLHDLGRESLRDRLAALGWLDPIPPALDPEGPAGGRPPDGSGRAANRMRLVRQHGGDGTIQAGWDVVYRRGNGWTFPIPADPDWDGTLSWQPQAAVRRLPAGHPADESRLLEEAEAHVPAGDSSALFRAGDYDHALRWREEDPAGPEGPPRLDPESEALCHARLGRMTAAYAVLDHAFGGDHESFPSIGSRLFCAVNHGLRPDAERCQPLVARGEALLHHPIQGELADRGVFDQCRGWIMIHSGRLAEGLRLLESNSESLQRAWRPRMLARTSCFLAAGFLRRRNRRAAREQVDLAVRLMLAEHLHGDVADHLIPVLAALAEPDEARRLIDRLIRIQRRRGHEPGLARAIWLRARRWGGAGDAAELARLGRRVEALQECRFLIRFLSGWHPRSPAVGAETPRGTTGEEVGSRPTASPPE